VSINNIRETNNTHEYNRMNTHNLLIDNTMLTQLQHGLSTTSILHRRSSNILRGAPILRQQTMGQQSVKDKTYIWGNALSTKQQGVIRLGFRNINSLPVHKSDQKKF
jgi:hypothetical protein